MRTSRSVRAALALALVVVLGGCGMVEQMTWDEYPDDAVLVPIAEKELIGYDQPSTVSRGQLQAGVLEHFEESAAALEPVIEAAVGRPVEVTAMSAIYPDSAVKVVFLTRDEPVVGFSTVVGVRSDGSVSAHPAIEGVDGFDEATVSALYRMAYRERFDQMREYLQATYPQFTGLPEGYLRSIGMTDPIFSVGFSSGTGAEARADQTAIKAIYRAYQEDPDRTAAEWQTVFEQEAGDRLISQSVSLLQVDPQGTLSEADARQIVLDIRDNPLFVGTARWSVTIRSNLVLRDRDRFHDYWGITIEKDDVTEDDWHVTHKVDGGDVL